MSKTVSQLRELGIRLVCGAALLFCSLASAQEAPPPSDVRLIIDVSGSMKQNDPENLRQPAVELLLKLMPEESKAGIWTFGQYVNMLIPHGEVNDSWRESAEEKAQGINSVGLYTNIGGALDKATYDRDRASGAYSTHVVLLTDGMVDIDKDPAKNQQEWRRIVDELLPSISSANYKIHTIALSENADTALMDKLALSTGGISEVAADADALMKVFLRVFDQSVPAEQLPLSDNSFLVDSSVEEFTALIFTEPGSPPVTLLSPDQTEYSANNTSSDVQWHKADGYELITLQKPLEGEWFVQADIAPDSRITVVSNLNLLVKPLPANLLVGQSAELSLLLQEQGSTVTDPNFLSLLTITAAIDHEESAVMWNYPLSTGAPPSSGIYAVDLENFKEEGGYQLSAVIDGKTFKRQFAHRISVREPFQVILDNSVSQGQEVYSIRIRSHGGDIDNSKVSVVAQIKNPARKSSIEPLQLQPNDEWLVELKPQQEGQYQVKLRISGTDKSGNEFEYQPEPLVVNYPSADNPFSKPESAAEPEPKPESIPEPPQDAPVENTEEEVVEEEPVEEESSNWMLYAGLGLGNLVLIALAFFAYRFISKGSKEDEIEALEKAVDEAVAEKPAQAAEPEASGGEPETSEEPPLVDEAIEQEVPVVTEEVAEEEAAGDLEMASIELDDEADDEGIDLSSDEATEDAIEMENSEVEAPEMEGIGGDDDLGEMEQLGGMEDLGSMDDLDVLSDLDEELGDDTEAEELSSAEPMDDFSLDDFDLSDEDETADDEDKDK